MNKFKVIGLAGMLLGFVAGKIMDYADSKEQEAFIDERIEKALAERDNQETQ